MLQDRTTVALDPASSPAESNPAGISATIGPHSAKQPVRQRRNRGDFVVLDKGEMPGMVMAIANQRDQSAYRRVFEHFGPRVKSYLLGLKIAPDQVDDVLQEVMIAVWHKASSYRPEKAAVSTWIFTIARNKHIDRIRRDKFQTYDAVDDDAAEAEVADHDIADQQLLTMQRKQAVQAALSKLPEDQMTVISMSFLKDMAHGEIANSLDLPLGTVKSRIRLGFQRLRQELGDTL